MDFRIFFRVIGAVVLLGVGIPSLLAMPEYASIDTYYSDATYTVVTGHTYRMCTSTWSEGVWSDYIDIGIYTNCSSQTPDDRGEHSPLAWEPCGDSVDNDDDGLIDWYDPGCH